MKRKLFSIFVVCVVLFSVTFLILEMCRVKSSKMFGIKDGQFFLVILVVSVSIIITLLRPKER